MKKYLPPCYEVLLPTNILKDQFVNIVVFPNKKVITSRYIKKVEERIKSRDLPTLFFADHFTMESKKIIGDSGGIIFSSGYGFEWTDKSWSKVNNGEF